jgi:hypothetical protein
MNQEQFSKAVDSFLIGNNDISMSPLRLVVNKNIELKFENDQQRAQFMIAVIRKWPKQIGCDGVEYRWGVLFGYKYFHFNHSSTCFLCRRTMEMVALIWGSIGGFVNSPFVNRGEDGDYECNLTALYLFAETGDLQAGKEIFKSIKKMEELISHCEDDS